jgi:hypothetical protein
MWRLGINERNEKSLWWALLNVYRIFFSSHRARVVEWSYIYPNDYYMKLNWFEKGTVMQFISLYKFVWKCVDRTKDN